MIKAGAPQPDSFPKSHHTILYYGCFLEVFDERYDRVRKVLHDQPRALVSQLEAQAHQKPRWARHPAGTYHVGRDHLK